MNWIKLVLIGVFSIGLLGAGIWCGLKIKELRDTNSSLNEELMNAKLEVGKAHTQFGEAQDKISLLEKQLRDEIKAHKELIEKYGELLAQYNATGGGTVINPPSDAPPPISTAPIFSPGKLYVALTESSLQPYTPPIPFIFTDHRIDIQTTLLTVSMYDFPYYLVADFKYNLHLKIMAQFVETITESGAVNNYANIFEIDDKGNRIGKFDITKFEVVVDDQRKPKFHLWNPKLDLGTAIGYNGNLVLGGDIGFSVASYGLSKNDLTWRFLRVGVSLYNDGVGLSLSPVVWNLGDPLPLIQNLWISPNILYDLNDRLFGVGVILSISL